MALFRKNKTQTAIRCSVLATAQAAVQVVAMEVKRAAVLDAQMD